VRKKLQSRRDNFNMASAMYPDDTKAPPTYEFHSETNSGVPYQQQGSTPLYPPIVGKLRRFK
jgi:hypothetical protein